MTNAIPGAERVADYIRQDYLDVRVLPDGSVAALLDLLFTRAVVLGCTRYGWSRRYCFENRGLATVRYLELQTEDDEPQGYVARR